ncbi:MAG: hypothetical protein NTZ49_03345 [Candidatus Parcubacteria bacterium]|nr:hypothetical protein [Candidatus Parcubacteria bacterium]
MANLEIESYMCQGCGTATKILVKLDQDTLTDDQKKVLKNHRVLIVKIGEVFKCSGCGTPVTVTEK